MSCENLDRVSYGDDPRVSTNTGFRAKWRQFRSENPRTVRVTLWVLIALVSVILWSALPKNDAVNHVLMTLLAVILVHLLDKWHMSIDFREGMHRLQEENQKTSKDNHKETQGNIKKLIQATGDTIKALLQVGAERVYQTRTAASMDLCQDLDRALKAVVNTLKHRGNSNSPSQSDAPVIRLMGVSLNDFIQKEQLNLGRVWERLCELIDRYQFHPAEHADEPAGTPASLRRHYLEVKILIVHPECLGAELRSRGEQRAGSGQNSRLRSDVADVSKVLLDYERRSQNSPIKLSCRLYQIPPTCFMGWMEDCCYVEPYFFWNQRHHINVPVAKFRNEPQTDGRTDSDTDRQIHHQLRHHFEWIWSTASIGVDDYVEGHVMGVDKAIHESLTINIFNDKYLASNRMCYLLGEQGPLKDKEAPVQTGPDGGNDDNPDVWLMGISLHAFFSNGPLAVEMARLIKEGRSRIHVLLIDPDSEQARWRAFREEGNETSTYSMFNDQELAKSRLVKDSESTRANIRQMIKDVRKVHGGGWQPRIEIRQYRSDPACFTLGVGGHVLFEPYHYGKAHSKDGFDIQALLGKEMPVFEFLRSEDESRIFPMKEEQAQRQPYLLLKDHFYFVWKNSEKVPLDDPASGGAPAP